MRYDRVRSGAARCNDASDRREQDARRLRSRYVRDVWHNAVYCF